MNIFKRGTLKFLTGFIYTCVLFILNCTGLTGQSWIRINQLGYQPNSIKVAVFVSKSDQAIDRFEIREVLTDQVVWQSEMIKPYGEYSAFKNTYRLDFSWFGHEGYYYISADGIKSPNFKIACNVYNHTADFLLKYMRQQRCGFNPFFKDSCHTHDGFIIFHPDPEKDSTYINVVGGWHDASDYLQYVTTSANATFQMMFAYEQNPDAFSDLYDKDGTPPGKGIPDVLDEAKWGLDWLLKMNPEKGVMFNQIADDRDHIGFKLPNKDTAGYDRGRERPVYFCTGKPQGSLKYRNRTTGIASTAGKYASAFALGSRLMFKYYPEFSINLKQKAIEAYEFGLKNPGVCQTAPCRSPYFYEEENWVDDMELAAYQLYAITNDERYLLKARNFGNKEPLTPWMGADTAKHYQWYPFINLGHYYLSLSSDEEIRNKFSNYLKQGIDRVYQKAKSNPFFMGIPFIWCSNNLVVAMVTQCQLYTQVTYDSTYAELEAALRDWLFGCNPWGTSMIIGLPPDGDSPQDTHSALTYLLNEQPLGGLVDGPVYGSIYSNLKGIYLANEDEYKDFQSDYVVYHDDFADYSTNEPTMDGTASLIYYLSTLQKKGMLYSK